MRLTYRTRRRDILLGRMLAIVYNRTLLIVSVLAVFFITYQLSKSAIAESSSLIFRVVFVTLALAFVTTFYLGVQLVLNGMMIFSGKNTGVVGEHTLEIKEEGVEESTAFNKSLHRWNLSFKIRECIGYVWIYPTDGQFFIFRNNPELCHGDVAAFLDAIRVRMHQPPIPVVN